MENGLCYNQFLQTRPIEISWVPVQMTKVVKSGVAFFGLFSQNVCKKLV